MSVVPLSVLVNAVAALKAAKDLNPTDTLTTDRWMDVMRAHNELSYYVQKITEAADVEVA